MVIFVSHLWFVIATHKISCTKCDDMITFLNVTLVFRFGWVNFLFLPLLVHEVIIYLSMLVFRFYTAY